MSFPFDVIRERAAGRWDEILPALAPDLAAAAQRAPRKVDCPLHGGRNDFRFDREFRERGSAICTCGAWGDGFSLLADLKGLTIKEAFEEVARFLGIDLAHNSCPPPRPPPRRPVAIPKARPTEYYRGLLRRIWAEAVPGDHPEAEPLRLYLRKRGILPPVIPAALRLHPRLEYLVPGANGKKRCIGHPPAMVALVSDAAGKPVTLHRTYLDMRGNKAPVPEVKMQLPTPIEGAEMGGAIRLFPPGPVLGVAEGIETALAAHLGSGMPVWSCLNTSLLEKFIAPEGVELLVIWADLDKRNQRTGQRAGEKAANALAERVTATGREALILYPPGDPDAAGKGIDWCDVYVAQGRRGFPRVTWGDLLFGPGFDIEPATAQLPPCP